MTALESAKELLQQNKESEDLDIFDLVTMLAKMLKDKYELCREQRLPIIRQALQEELKVMLVD